MSEIINKDNFAILVDRIALDELSPSSRVHTVIGGRHRLYKCPAGKWTIGYGRNVEDNGISEVEALDLLTRDVINAQRDAASLFTNWLLLNDVRRNALANMAYNMGRKSLSGFHDLISAVLKEDWPAAKAAMVDSKWHSDVGQRAIRLENEMLTGKVA